MTDRADYVAIPMLRRVADLFDLAGRSAVIVGGAGRLGNEFGLTLAEAGARVAIFDQDSARAEAAARELTADSREVIGLACDVMNEDAVRRAFDDLASRWRSLEILIYAVMAKPAGYYATLDRYRAKTWEQVLHADLSGAFFCAREAARLMPDGGSIILVSSIYGVVGPDHRIYAGNVAGANPYGHAEPLSLPPSYAAAKAGLIGLTKHLATSWARRQIRVNVLVPGGVFDGQPEPFHHEYVQRTPLGRMATPSDFNGAVLFLASDASRYMTGSSLVVDGGWTAW